MNTQIETKQVRRIIDAAFPGYRKRKVWIDPCGSVTLHDLNWSGGTRSEYRAVTLNGKELGNSGRLHQLAPWDPQQQEGTRLPIPEGAVMVRGGHFCGKTSTITIYCNPADMPRLLPEAHHD